MYLYSPIFPYCKLGFCFLFSFLFSFSVVGGWVGDHATSSPQHMEACRDPFYAGYNNITGHATGSLECIMVNGIG